MHVGSIYVVFAAGIWNQYTHTEDSNLVILEYKAKIELSGFLPKNYLVKFLINE